MAFEIRWLCQQGTRTADNRDYAGVGIRGDSTLLIVLDGSTRGKDSGAFAREIARGMVDWFAIGGMKVTAESLTEQLRRTHAALSRRFRRDSASFALLHAGKTQPILALHAGDCLIGCDNASDGISWLYQPHTLANAVTPVPIDVLAKDDARHVLTRSFRSRAFMAPEVSSIEPEHQRLVIATDGFWAELDANQQNDFIEERFTTLHFERDDCSALVVSRSELESLTEVAGLQASQNIYMRRA